MKFLNFLLDYDSVTDTYHGLLSDLKLEGDNTHPLSVEVEGEELPFLFKFTRSEEGEGDSKISAAYIYKNDYGSTLILTYDRSELLRKFL